MSGYEEAIAGSPLNFNEANWRYSTVVIDSLASCSQLPGIAKAPVGSVSYIHKLDEYSRGETVLTSSSLCRSPFSFQPFPLLKTSGVVYLPTYKYSQNLAKIPRSISSSTATRLIDSFMWPLVIRASRGADLP